MLLVWTSWNLHAPPSLAGCSLLPPADAGSGASHPLVSSADSCLNGSRAIGCSGLGLEQGWSRAGAAAAGSCLRSACKGFLAGAALSSVATAMAPFLPRAILQLFLWFRLVARSGWGRGDGTAGSAVPRSSLARALVSRLPPQRRLARLFGQGGDAVTA